MGANINVSECYNKTKFINIFFIYSVAKQLIM